MESQDTDWIMDEVQQLREQLNDVRRGQQQGIGAGNHEIRQLNKGVQQGLAERDVLTKYVLKLEDEFNAMARRLEDLEPGESQVVRTQNPLR